MPARTSDADSAGHSDSDSNSTDCDSDSTPPQTDTHAHVETDTHAPKISAQAAFVVPPFLWAASVASIAGICKCLPTAAMDTPGICPAALAIPYALPPIYIACHWVPGAFRRFWPASLASKLGRIATVAAVAFALVVHALILAGLASFKLKASKATPLGLVFDFAFVALLDTLLFMAWAWRARALSTAARIVATVLVAILAILCICCYLGSLQAVLDKGEHGFFVLPRQVGLHMPRRLTLLRQ